MRFLIIGSGPAGIFAAEAIRRKNREDPILMVSADSTFAQSPVMLSYWIGGKVSRQSLLFRDPSWSERERIDVRLNSKAVSLKTPSSKVVLADGQEISYDRLLIATGSIPISLPIPGAKSKGVNVLRTLKDAETILEKDPKEKEMIIIGGGFIGLKLACHLKGRGLSVMILEKESKLASRMFDIKTSRLVEKRLKEEGIRVETDVEVAEVLHKEGRVSAVHLKDGRTFPCQRVVEVVGVQPSIEWIIDSGIQIEGGILVNDRMETNMEGIYAAGDVTMTVDPITLARVNHATWPAATRQGIVAGTNMAGGDLLCHHHFALNSLNLYGLQVMAAGHAHYEKESDVDVILNEGKEYYRKIVIKDGRMIGFILIGDISGAGFLLSLMQKRVGLPSNQWNRVLSCQASQPDLPPHLGFDHGFLFQEGKE